MLCVTKAEPVPYGTQTLRIGKAANSTNYYVYLEHAATRERRRFSVTSDGSGFLELDISSLEYSIFNDYHIWITITTVLNHNEVTKIKINGSEKDALAFEFVPLRDSNGDIINFTKHNLELA